MSTSVPLNPDKVTAYTVADTAAIFDQVGFAIYGMPVVDDVALKRIRERVMSFGDLIAYHRIGTSTLGGKSDYRIIDANGVNEFFPEVMDAYLDCRSLTSEVVGRDVIFSPYHQSSVNIRYYKAGCSGGDHFDTQPVTCLLFLSDGGPLDIEIQGTRYLIPPLPGCAAFFHGRDMRHGVPASDGKVRITAPLNYYFDDDTERPDYIDKLCYGGSDAES